VVTFHRSLSGSLRVATGRAGGHGTRSDAELLLEILDLEPERQVFFTKVVTQELAETGAKRGLLNDES